MNAYNEVRLIKMNSSHEFDVHIYVHSNMTIFDKFVRIHLYQLTWMHLNWKAPQVGAVGMRVNMSIQYTVCVTYRRRRFVTKYWYRVQFSYGFRHEISLRGTSTGTRYKYGYLGTGWGLPLGRYRYRYEAQVQTGTGLINKFGFHEKASYHLAATSNLPIRARDK